MSAYDARLPELLASLRWELRPERFALVGLPPAERARALKLLAETSSPFAQWTIEPGMITLVLPQDDWTSMASAFPAAELAQPYRVISFPMDLPPDLTGFMATLADALALAGVPLLALCGFARDHLLVREHDTPAALAALEQLRGE